MFASAVSVDIGLIAVFFVAFPILVQGLIAFAVAQTLGERKQNRDYQREHGSY